MKPGFVPEAAHGRNRAASRSFRRFGSEPKRHSPRPHGHGRPGIPPDQSGGREDAVRLHQSHAAAGLADPGGGRADGHRDVDLGPATADDLPGLRRGHDRPARIQPRPFDHGIARHRPPRSHAQERYIPNRIAQLQSKELAERVFSNPSFASEVAAFDDPAQELILNGLQVRPIAKTNMILRHARGQGPDADQEAAGSRCSRNSRTWPQTESRDRTEDTKVYANDRLENAQERPRALDNDIYDPAQDRTHHRPGRKEHL